MTAYNATVIDNAASAMYVRATNSPFTALEVDLEIGPRMVSIATKKLAVDEKNAEVEAKTAEYQLQCFDQKLELKKLDHSDIHAKLREYREYKKSLNKAIAEETDAEEKKALEEERKDIEATITALRGMLPKHK